MLSSHPLVRSWVASVSQKIDNDFSECVPASLCSRPDAKSFQQDFTLASCSTSACVPESKKYSSLCMNTRQKSSSLSRNYWQKGNTNLKETMFQEKIKKQSGSDGAIESHKNGKISTCCRWTTEARTALKSSGQTSHIPCDYAATKLNDVFEGKLQYVDATLGILWGKEQSEERPFFGYHFFNRDCLRI